MAVRVKKSTLAANFKQISQALGQCIFPPRHTLPWHPRITWLNTVQRDLTAYNLTLNEAVDLAQNRPL